jgi:hypothetical protein
MELLMHVATDLISAAAWLRAPIICVKHVTCDNLVVLWVRTLLQCLLLGRGGSAVAAVVERLDVT